ncbi:NAD(P)-dependent oxidoreductase [Steroidobacter sp. S1-65]|uniref:NAD(P)-dependent oxidoreductase n=1 Tax=Steroidobacter gossypii TaxID=2805490 RepID=A0ABS1WWZ7_9GAMM|nr:NAD(P)-dependent oxidoreductase [Steroidobacter gossypii]MBM0105499.1 NAD(P)-dependent oxidoreductase [Steroidobacter gossypii]
MANVTFIGLGRMGIGMAQRLGAAGHRLRIYNRTPERAAALVAQGATLCASPREAAEGAEVIISMVADDAASREVWLGKKGLLSDTVPAGTLAIECSTLSHDWVLELAAEAQQRSLSYIDCPVTGLPDMAAAGELTLLVGASTEDLARAQPVLEAIAKRTVHFGAIGAGTAYKLMINLQGAIQIAAIAEGMALAERAGLNLHTVAEAIATGQAASPQVVRNAWRIVDGEHDRNIQFTPQLRVKDVDYALRLARKLGIGAPFGALADAAYRQLCELGHANSNESKIVEVARAQRSH